MKTKTVSRKAEKKEEEDDEKDDIRRGMPKSGRWWKSVRQERHSAIVKVKPLKTSWEKKMNLKADKKAVKMLQTEIRDKQKAEKEAKKQEKIDREKRREDNLRKSEIVQVIRNTKKLKKVKRKQLRMIEKRDTN